MQYPWPQYVAEIPPSIFKTLYYDKIENSVQIEVKKARTDSVYGISNPSGVVFPTEKTLYTKPEMVVSFHNQLFRPG